MYGRLVKFEPHPIILALWFFRLWGSNSGLLSYWFFMVHLRKPWWLDRRSFPQYPHIYMVLHIVHNLVESSPCLNTSKKVAALTSLSYSDQIGPNYIPVERPLILLSMQKLALSFRLKTRKMLSKYEGCVEHFAVSHHSWPTQPVRHGDWPA